MKVKNIIIYSFLFLFCFSALSSLVQAAYGPSAFVTENVTQNYWWNGTAKGADVRSGYVEVSVPNDEDVLQYVRVNLSSIDNTNLENSTAYDNVVTSYPTTNRRDTIYVNTTVSEQSTTYTIDTDAAGVNAAPTINLSLSYTNYHGGTDIYDSDNIGTGGTTNTLRFNYTIRNPSSTKTLSGAIAILQFNTTSGSNNRDAVNITLATNSTTADAGSSTTSSTISNTDSGSDGDNDRYTWIGTLGPSAQVYIEFNATLYESNSQGNIYNGVNSINLDGDANKGGLGNYSDSTNTLSGRTINYKLSMGSIRQGVDLQVSGGTWYARGLIRNMAANPPGDGESLTYNITGWRIYEINPGTGAPYNDANLTGKFNYSSTSYELTPDDGQIYTNTLTRSNTNQWYNTTSGSKPYIASYFDWYVLWNASNSQNYEGYINTTTDMQTLYKVDQVYLKALTGVIYPDTGNQVVTVNDTVYYTGSSSISAGNLALYSIVPVNTTTGYYHGLFDITASSVKVYFQNSSGCTGTSCQLAGDANVNWTVTDPTYWANNGTVLVTIKDLSSASVVGGGTVARNLSASGDRIYVTFDVLSNASMTTGDRYIFTGNSTLTTTSGTPESENVYSPQEIQVSTKRIIGYKDLFVMSGQYPTLVNATLNVTVQATVGEYIPGIKFTDYVVNGTFGAGNNNLSNYISNLTVKYCNDTCHTWANGTDYNVTHGGTRALSDGTAVEVYEFIKASDPGTFNLSNGDYIQVDYQMDVGTSGTYILPLQIAAFDPSTGESFSAEAFGVIRVDVPSLALPLQITDHNLELAKRVVVGTPAIWIKNFEAYNPNARPISSKFETTVFGDAMEGFVSYYNDKGEKIEESVVFGNVENGKKKMSWESTLNPLETRTYEIRVLTPPVMEVDRDVEVLDKLENKMVKLKMDVFLKSFAEEKYSNIVLNLPISYENILEVKDGFGRSMQFTGGKDTASIILDEIEPAGLKTISIIYKASYPTIIITPDRDRYDLSAPVNLEILVINGGETIEYPYVEVEIYTPGMDVIYSNLERLKTMEPLEKTQNYQKFIIPANAPGGMYIASAKFREDFTVLASTTGNFFVAGSVASTPEVLQIIAVLSITGVLVYFSIKRMREFRRTKRLLEGAGPVA